MIRGANFFYDRDLDIVSLGLPSIALDSLNRTQVDQAVDFCVEITTWCNFQCQNCFSESIPGKPGHLLDYSTFRTVLSEQYEGLIRVCLTGGEPLSHPEIQLFLTTPSSFAGLGYVLTTNGTLRPEVDSVLSDYDWLVAMSLHGGREAQRAYTGIDSFDIVRKRIESLAKVVRTHIYCVIHDGLTIEDVDWLLRFRVTSGAKFLRFILPRKFGRFKPLVKQWLIPEILSRLDDASAIKRSQSETILLGVDGEIRRSA